MKQSLRISGIRRIKLLLLASLTALLLSACISYGPPYSYPSGYYSYQSGARYYQPNYAYYGAYQPGWFVAAPYYPGNYWGYGAMVYWPTYSSSYYFSNHYYGRRSYYGGYYPYSDPWYYPYSGHYRHIYGHYYGPYNSPYYGYGAIYGSRYRPSYGGVYYGNSHGYRPPGSQHGSRPDPVVIPPGQRGGRGPGAGYNDTVDERLRQRDRYQPERRSTTVVSERDGISRSVGVAPAQDGSQGMVITNRSERKVQPSRMHPVPGDSRPQIPAQSSNSRAIVRPNAPRPEPMYQQQQNIDNVVPRAERQQPRDTERGRQRGQDRDQQ